MRNESWEGVHLSLQGRISCTWMPGTDTTWIHSTNPLFPAKHLKEIKPEKLILPGHTSAKKVFFPGSVHPWLHVAVTDQTSMTLIGRGWLLYCFWRFPPTWAWLSVLVLQNRHCIHNTTFKAFNNFFGWHYWYQVSKRAITSQPSLWPCRWNSSMLVECK